MGFGANTLEKNKKFFCDFKTTPGKRLLSRLHEKFKFKLKFNQTGSKAQMQGSSFKASKTTMLEKILKKS